MLQVSEQDFACVPLGDKRRNRRLATLVNNICRQPGSSIPKQSEDWYNTKAAYWFFQNEAICEEALQQSIQAYGVSQLSGQQAVLVAHDITTVSFGGLHSEGLGYLVQPPSKGGLCYCSIAVSLSGRPLSLLYQHTWTRPQGGRAKNTGANKRPLKTRRAIAGMRALKGSTKSWAKG